MPKRYRLHWASGRGPSPALKWQIWDWTLRCAVVHVESRSLGRTIAGLLNEQATLAKLAALTRSKEPQA